MANVWTHPRMREYPTQQWQKDKADEDAIVLERRQEAAVILLFETLVCGSGPSSAWAVFQLGDCPDVNMRPSMKQVSPAGTDCMGFPCLRLAFARASVFYHCSPCPVQFLEASF